jgi:translin
MRGLEEIVADIETEMDERDTVRELAVKSSRSIGRLASTAIRRMHRREDATETLRTMRDEVAQLGGVLRGHPELFHSGLVANALQEVAEAAVVHAFLRGEPAPSPADLGVPSAAYLLGLADAVGELRRFALDALRAGDLATSDRHLATMEEILDALLRFDYPAALVAIKPKQDVARSLIERTRGELAVASRGLELERKLAAMERQRGAPP